MNAPAERSPEDWLDRWLDGGLSADDQAALEQWLQADPHHLQQWVAASARQQMLCDAARGELLSDEVRERAAERIKPTRPTGRPRIVTATLTLVALLAVVIWFGRPHQGPPNGGPPNGGPQRQGPAIAESAAESTEPGAAAAAFASVASVTDSDSQLPAGTRLRAQSLQFERGLVRLLFDDGVEVTLQGPVHYELIAPGKTWLHAGLLTATVPAGAEGFRVETPTAQVVDLGTAFGVEQTPDGLSNVAVFDGEVEVVSDSEKRLLTEGDALQLAADGSLQTTEVPTAAFEKLWPAASGIRRSTGAFEFAPQWPRRLKRVESDDRIFVLPEGYAITLPEDCPIDLPEAPLTRVIAAGQRVRSFLLQFNPVNADGPPFGNQRNPRGGRNGRRISGRITFERPVLGLIIDTDTLNETDSLFDFQRGGGLFGRGLEQRPPRIADDISLSDDRRTLTLDLFVVDRLSDHVRVIVDAALYADRPLAANPSR